MKYYEIMEANLIHTYQNNHARCYKESVVMLSPTNNREYSERFLRYLDVSERTIETYRKGLHSFFSFLIKWDIIIPTRNTILEYKHYLKATNHKPTTITGYIVAVRLFFKWLHQEDIYPNIADNIKGEKISIEHKKDYLTTNQLKEVFKTTDKTDLKSLRDYAILSLMTTTGLRTIEVIRAKVEDIKTAGDDVVLYIQGKGRTEKSEYVKLAPQIEKILRQYLEASKNKDYIFTGVSNNKTANNQLTTRSISRIIKTHFREAGLNSDRLTAHSLRHTAGTLNLMNGGTLEETQQLLRHNKISTTMIYLHHLQRANNKSEERIAGAIFS